MRIGRSSLMLNGIIALAVTSGAALLFFHAIPATLDFFMLGALIIGYTLISALRPAQLVGFRLPGALKSALCTVVGHAQKEARKDKQLRRASALDRLTLIPTLISIVLASVGMLRTATSVGHAWAIPPALTGMLVLAVLAGIPNVVAAVCLARRGRGSAVFGEGLNSNSLNIISGLCLPVLVLGRGSVSSRAVLAVWWLLGMTVATLLIAAWRQGLDRFGSSALMAMYGAFVVLTVLHA